MLGIHEVNEKNAIDVNYVHFSFFSSSLLVFFELIVSCYINNKWESDTSIQLFIYIKECYRNCYLFTCDMKKE